MTATVITHSLIQHKLSLLRSEDTDTKSFRELVEEIAMLMFFEVSREIPLQEVDVKTPLATAKCRVIAGKKLHIAAVLRAGLGMVGGILKLLPTAKVGHIGLYRDEASLQPKRYYDKFPEDVSERDSVVLDPMLATGGSASFAISLLKAKGGKNIKLMCLVAAPEGIRKVNEDHPDVGIYCAAIDDGLNDRGYILPGLGDAGDRIFGTK